MNVWLICEDHKSGTWAQLDAICSVIKLKYHNATFHKVYLEKKYIYSSLPCFLQFFPLKIHDFPKNLPDLVIASGRGAVSTATAIKKKGIKTIFVLNPNCSTDNFNLVLCPKHDNVFGDNVINFHGALNNFTYENIKNEFNEKSYLFNHLPRPFTSIMLGGDSKHYKFDEFGINETVDSIKNIISSNDFSGSILLSSSRRTPPLLFKMVSKLISDKPNFIYDGKTSTENPYKAFIYCADKFIVTPDSVSMLCETAFMGKGVFHTDIKFKNKRFNRFINDSYKKKVLFPIECFFHENLTINKLDEINCIKYDLLTNI